MDMNNRMKLILPVFLALLCGASLQSADEAWHWAGRTPGSAVTILLLGDINVEKRADPADAFRNVRATLNSADLVYGNLEGLLVKSQGPDKDIPDKTGWQHIGPEAVRALKAGHIQVVGVANNVAYGPENIMKSLAVLDADGILHTGAGANIEDAHKPAIITVKGVKIGFLQYTAKWYAQDQQIASATRPGVARILSKDGITIDETDLNRFREDIRRLRPLVDVLVVSSHDRDGLGRSLSPAILAETRPATAAKAEEQTKDALFSPIPLGPQFSETETYQKTLAHEAIDAGADIVFGHGSHVLQGVDIYKGKPVMYCLGNFAMDWIRMSPNKEGMVARVVVDNKRVTRLSLVPLTRDAQNNVLMLDPASGEGAKLLEKLKKLSGDVQVNIEGKEAVLIAK
jgi:poly-gamma-glutamate capsule biosynthesis protein CapA/YwtB (metallophosphatase superfamily)